MTIRVNTVLVSLVLTILFSFQVGGSAKIDVQETRNTIESFGGGVSTGLPTVGDFNCVGVGDINGDGYQDLVIGAEENYGTLGTKGLYAFFGSGDGTWTQYTISDTGSFAYIEIRDCDNDGYQEVYACYQENTFGVGAWEWNGTGFSKSGITSPLTSGAVSYLRIENITGGPGLDMAIGTQNGVKYFEGSGTSPITWTEYSSGLRNRGMCTAIDVNDLNGDGLLDMVVGQYGDGMFIFQQSSSGRSWTDVSGTLPEVERSGRMMGLVTGDVNDDGYIDIVYGRRTHPDGLFLLLGNGGGPSGDDLKWTYLNGSWSPRPTSTFYQMHLSDVDNDGDLDLLAATESSGLHLYLGDGSDEPGNAFTWTRVVDKGLPGTMKFYGANFIDLDNDGDLDVAGCTWGNGAMVFRNNITQPPNPVARAGRDRTMFLGDSVILDGTLSYDAQDCPDGDPTGTILTYDWTVTSQPPGSIMTDADLSPSDRSAKVNFTPTHEGNYTISLSVTDTDGFGSLLDDDVNVQVIIANTPPVSNAGEDQSVFAGSIVHLNGSGSYDVEDELELLGFEWLQNSSNPVQVELSDGSAQNPYFAAPEVTGNYTFHLVITDTLGEISAPDSVIITVTLRPNIRPTSHAGTDIEAVANTTVRLNGSLSFDPDGDIIDWSWVCASHPSIELNDSSGPYPYFVPNRIGTYSFTLTVQDDRSEWSDPDNVNVVVLTDNYHPIAHAGKNRTVHRNTTVVLNGSLSSDEDGQIVAWNWTSVTHPEIILIDRDTPNPQFFADETGMYLFSLRVMDDKGLWSAPSRVRVTVIEESEDITVPVENLPPRVTVLYPASGMVLSGRVNISWSAFDPDMDPLYIEIRSRNESGTRTMLFAGPMPTEQVFVWDTSMHQDGTYWIEIMIDDGYDSGMDESGPLSIKNELEQEEEDEEPPEDFPEPQGEPRWNAYRLAVYLIALLIICLVIFGFARWVKERLANGGASEWSEE